MNFTVEVDGYIFEIEITYFRQQLPDYNADNSDDFYGFTEFEYDVIFASYTDEDGFVSEYTEQEILEKAVDFESEIRDNILKQINTQENLWEQLSDY